MKFSIVYKFSLSVIILVLVSSGMVGALFYAKTTKVLVENTLEDITVEIRNAGRRLQMHVEAQYEDVLFLAHTPPVQGFLRARKDGNFDKEDGSTLGQWESRLAAIFIELMKRKAPYDKIRFIDKSGQEIIVVGREKGQIVSIKTPDLQNKAHREYFSETLKLPPESVYLSEMNLNREYGKVSVPHMEVMRAATPVFDFDTGLVAGVLVLTVDVSHELLEIQRNIKGAGREIYITNDKGEYLLHPDGDKDFAFDLGHDYNIQQDIPQLEILFLPETQSSRLVLLPKDTGGSHLMSFLRVPFDPSRPERFIAVGITKLYDEILAKQKNVLNDVLFWALVLAALATFLAALLAYRLSKPIKLMTQIMNDYIHNRKSTELMPVDQGDEIGVLARSYQTLIGQVEDAQKSLEEMNRNLETKVAERTRDLETSELRQRTIVEHMVDGLITIDEKGIITMINPAAIELFGYRADEVVGKNLKMLMPEPYHSEHDGYLKNYSTTHQKKIIGIGREVEGLHKNGRRFPIDLAVSEILVDGQKLYTGLVRDITERKEMDKMKNEFISTVSHELRTPLTSIRGSLGLITGGAVGKLPEQANEMLRIASNNTERLLLLINDILDIQKIESGEMAFKFCSLDLKPFLEQAVAENEGYGAQHGVKFVIAQTLENAWVYADKDRLMQVMANLFSNAAKFSPVNGTVEISLAHHHTNILRISVTDKGPGIPEEFQPKLYDKFTQSDSSDTRQKGGTGLGLSISKVIVEKHGGRINFVSSEGIGTTFYVELPGLAGKRTGDEKGNMPQQLSDNTSEPSVLIVEDDHDIAALIRRMLAESGYDSDIAYSVEEAKVKLTANPGQYEVITLDLVLPGEGGMSFMTDLKQDSLTRDIPVVVVSVMADETRQSLNGEAIDVIDWLQKPIDQKRLIAAINQASGSLDLPRVLHVEDDEDVHKVVSTMLSAHCTLIWASTLAAAREALDSEKFDLLLLDIGLPDGSGLELLEMLDKISPPLRVVIFSAYDVTEEYVKKVSAVLIKSKTNNFKLGEVIKNVIANSKKSS
ncbi:hypothetical protein MNBD_ALPHA03-304 [hydrothermal vent metagenome]|uniref:histidine kinase n=1 Tax=hydrothermal vent metagenome TaxID=652676 RepID=A0A3B1B914_9ZZZZ